MSSNSSLHGSSGSVEASQRDRKPYAVFSKQSDSSEENKNKIEEMKVIKELPVKEDNDAAKKIISNSSNLEFDKN